MEHTSKLFAAMEFTAQTHSHCAWSVMRDTARSRTALLNNFYSKCTDRTMRQDDTKNQPLLDYFSVAARRCAQSDCVNVIMLSRVLETGVVALLLCSVNAPLGISLVFHQWNLGITTRVMMFKVPSSKSLRCSSLWSHVVKNLLYFDKKNMAILVTRWLYDYFSLGLSVIF